MLRVLYWRKTPKTIQYELAILSRIGDFETTSRYLKFEIATIDLNIYSSVPINIILQTRDIQTTIRCLQFISRYLNTEMDITKPLHFKTRIIIIFHKVDISSFKTSNALWGWWMNENPNTKGQNVSTGN